MAKPELGSKQICTKCSAKFYDLGRRPAVCPKCGNAFDPEEALRSRRGRSATVPDYEAEEEKPAPDTDEGYGEEVDDTPEIDAAVEADVLEPDDGASDGPGVAVNPTEDIGVDFADEEAISDSDDVPFLEDEEEDFTDDDLGDIPVDDDLA